MPQKPIFGGANESVEKHDKLGAHEGQKDERDASQNEQSKFTYEYGYSWYENSNKLHINELG